MNEENVNPTEIKTKKKRSFLWLRLLFVLCIFAGGIIIGLKLPAMNLPQPVEEALFPAGQKTEETVMTELPAVQSTVMPKESEAPTVSAKPSVSPEVSAKTEKDAEQKNAPAAVQVSTAPAASAKSSGPIGVDAALKTALDHAKIKENDADIYGVYKEKFDGTAVYAVSFSANSIEYEYLINAETGVIESWKSSRRTELLLPSSPEPDTAVPAAAASNLPELIDVEAAKAAAFEHAGVNVSSVSDIKTELELENFKLVYEIQFDCGMYEYEYEIDAVSGDVLRFEKGAA